MSDDYAGPGVPKVVIEGNLHHDWLASETSEHQKDRLWGRPHDTCNCENCQALRCTSTPSEETT